MISALFIISSLAFTYLLHVITDTNYYFIPLWLLIGILLGFIITLLFVIIQLPIFEKTKLFNKYKIYTYRSVAYFLNRYVFRLRLEIVGRENIPNSGRLTVYANHKSYADPVIVMEAITRATSFTPKSGVYEFPFMHQMLASLGSFPIDRSSDRNTARAMVEAIKVVKKGMAMVIFPEGGIKDRNDKKMVAMRAGAYRLGVKAEADLLPVSIDGSIMIKHNLPFKRTKIKVTIHDLIKYEDIKGLKTSDLADKVFRVINEELTKND